MPTYASRTDVAPGRSREEIERTLTRYGATAFVFGQDSSRAVVGFVAHDRQVRFIVPIPDRSDPKYRLTPTGRRRTDDAVLREWEQENRQVWRAVLLMVKAKLEAVETGIVSFDQEFAMHYVLPDGRTVAEHVEPAITAAYESGDVPQLLPEYGETVHALPRGKS